MKRISYLLIFFLTLPTLCIAQEKEEDKKSAFTIVFGIIADAEAISTSLQDHSFTTTLAYIRKVNKVVSLGLETGYFTIYQENFIPIGVIIDSPLLNKRSSLNLQSSIGYTFADSQISNESGMNWGGVFVKLGLDFNTPVRGENILLKGGIHYRLQEKKNNNYNYWNRRNNRRFSTIN